MAGMFRRDRPFPMRRWLRWSALLLLLPCALASAGFGSKSRQLDEMMAAYTAALRWGSFEDGWQFIEPEVRKAHPLTEFDMSRYAQLQVTGYRDTGTSNMKDGSVVRDIEISITNRNTQSERSVRYREIWRWDDKAGRWWQTTGLPDFWDGQ